MLHFIYIIMYHYVTKTACNEIYVLLNHTAEIELPVCRVFFGFSLPSGLCRRGFRRFVCKTYVSNSLLCWFQPFEDYHDPTFLQHISCHDNYETASKNKKGSPLTAFTWKIYFHLFSHNVAHVFWAMLHYPSMAKLQQIVYFIDFMYTLMHISWNGQHYVRLAFFIFNKTDWNICFTCEVMFNVYSVFDCLKFVGIHLHLWKYIFNLLRRGSIEKYSEGQWHWCAP